MADYPNDLRWDLRAFSLFVSMEKTIDAKREHIRRHKQRIDENLETTIGGNDPLEAFSQIDGVKSIVSREILLRKRLEACGHTDFDAAMHGSWKDGVASLLKRETDLCVVNFYQSNTGEIWAFLAYASGDSIECEQIRIADEDLGKHAYNQITSIIAASDWGHMDATKHGVLPVLRLFGEELIPRLAKLGGNRRLLLVPHKWLHVLPLQVMWAIIEKRQTILDEVTNEVTTAPSLFCYEYRGRLNSDDESKPPGKLLLACVDIDNLYGGGQLEAKYYQNIVLNEDAADIVLHAGQFPKDLSQYGIVLLSCHGKADPSNWAKSRLSFGDRLFEADHIIDHWKLRNAKVAVLSACETGLDLSMDESLDEYTGLDMAVHIAGAPTVISTSWIVDDHLAAFMSTQIVEGLLGGIPPSVLLKLLRAHLLTNSWYTVIEKSYVRTKARTDMDPTRKAVRLEMLETLLQLPPDRFRHANHWGAFRCFGGW